MSEITLDITKAKFDLSQLTVEKVNIKESEVDLIVSKNTTLSFETAKTDATVNGVKIKQEPKLSNIIVTENGFRFTGSENKITIDASNAKSEINLEFVGPVQKGLEITSNNEYGVKLFTNTIEISQLLVKSGKVDVTEAAYSSIVLGGVNDKTNSVTLVTNFKAPDTKNDDKIFIDGTIYDWMNGYMMQATQNEIASYSTTAGSGIIKFNFKPTVKGSSEVMIHKVFKEESLENSKDLSEVSEYETAVKDVNLKSNMEHVDKVEVDENTNTITVTVDVESMTAYTVDGGSHKCYGLVIDTGIPREFLASGSRYDIDSGKEKEFSETLKLKGTEILVYLYAEDETTIVSFVDTRTGEEHFYTINVKPSED